MKVIIPSWPRVHFRPMALMALSFLALPAPTLATGLEVKDGKGSVLVGYAESHALVIWAGEYRNPFWKRLNNLREESTQVAQALSSHGFQVSVVANPTSTELRSSIESFIQRHGFKPDNRLVITFAGHGWTRKGDLGYLVPIDAPDASSIEGDLEFAKRALSMEQILSWSRQMEAKHVLFIFDSCFSGAIFKVRGVSRPPAYLERKISRPVRQLLTAGDANEMVPAKSLFTPLMIRGLNGDADLNQDGYITGSELGDYLPQSMATYSSFQNPQYGKIRDPALDEGDIVFRSPVRAPLTPAPVPLPAPAPTPTPVPSTAPAAKPRPDKPTTITLPSPAPAPAPASTDDKQAGDPEPAAGEILGTVTAETIVGPSAAVAMARERIPQGGLEKRNRCIIVAIAGTDRHRCTIWYSLDRGPSEP